MTVTDPGIVSTGDSGPRIRKSFSAQGGVVMGRGLTAAGRTAADAQLLKTTTAARPMAAFRATRRRAGRLITSMSATGSLRTGNIQAAHWPRRSSAQVFATRLGPGAAAASAIPRNLVAKAEKGLVPAIEIVSIDRRCDR